MNDHSSRRTITHTLQQPTRIQRGSRLRIPIWSCFRWGLPCHALLPAMRCALTAPFHPYRNPSQPPFRKGRSSPLVKGGFRGISAVYSLLHLPSAHAAQTLSGTLPFEARTFLPYLSHEDLRSSDRLAHFGAHFSKKPRKKLGEKLFFTSTLFHINFLHR